MGSPYWEKRREEEFKAKCIKALHDRYEDVGKEGEE